MKLEAGKSSDFVDASCKRVCVFLSFGFQDPAFDDEMLNQSHS